MHNWVDFTKGWNTVHGYFNYNDWNEMVNNMYYLYEQVNAHIARIDTPTNLPEKTENDYLTVSEYNSITGNLHILLIDVLHNYVIITEDREAFSMPWDSGELDLIYANYNDVIESIAQGCDLRRILETLYIPSDNASYENNNCTISGITASVTDDNLTLEA